MPVYLSGATPVNVTFSGGADRPTLVANLAEKILAAGWTQVSGAGTSDQVFQSGVLGSVGGRIRVKDPGGSNNCVNITILSKTGSIEHTVKAFLQYGGTRTYRLIGTPYALWIFTGPPTPAREVAYVYIPSLYSDVPAGVGDTAIILGTGSTNDTGTLVENWRTGGPRSTHQWIWGNTATGTSVSSIGIGCPQFRYPRTSGAQQSTFGNGAYGLAPAELTMSLGLYTDAGTILGLVPDAMLALGPMTADTVRSIPAVRGGASKSWHVFTNNAAAGDPTLMLLIP